jgi:hypothetical protein
MKEKTKTALGLLAQGGLLRVLVLQSVMVFNGTLTRLKKLSQSADALLKKLVLMRLSHRLRAGAHLLEPLAVGLRMALDRLMIVTMVRLPGLSLRSRWPLPAVQRMLLC